MSSSSTAVPTRFFQNDPPPKKRRSSDQLLDLTNSIPSSKRQCLKKAQESIIKQTRRQAPRAQPQKGAETRELNKCFTVAGPVENVESMTLQGIKKEQPYIFQEGGNRLEQYIHDNTTIGIRKAFALSVFQKAITDKNMKVINSAEVIRRWAMSCFGEFFATISCLEDIEDEELVFKSRLLHQSSITY